MPRIYRNTLSGFTGKRTQLDRHPELKKHHPLVTQAPDRVWGTNISTEYIFFLNKVLLIFSVFIYCLDSKTCQKDTMLQMCITDSNDTKEQP